MLSGVHAIDSSEEEQEESREENEVDEMDQDQSGEREEVIMFIRMIQIPGIWTIVQIKYFTLAVHLYSKKYIS